MATLGMNRNSESPRGGYLHTQTVSVLAKQHARIGRSIHEMPCKGCSVEDEGFLTSSRLTTLSGAR
jgi:hypothetical protein